MKIKHTLPFIIALGVTAGSTMAYAQSVNLETGTGLNAQVGDTEIGTNAATNTTTTLECADGATGCADASASADADADATLPMGSADADADVAADVDATLPDVGADVDASADVAADTGVSTMPGDSSLSVDGSVTALASADELVGVRVYDSNEEWIGEVSAVIPAEGTTEQQLVIDVGGFLGIGEKPVAIASSEIQVQTGDDGDVDHLIVGYSMAELEAMPEVEM